MNLFILDSLRCPICEITLQNKQDYERHRSRHIPLECTFCYKSFINEFKLKNHFESVHKINDEDNFTTKNYVLKPRIKILQRKNYIKPSDNQHLLFGFDTEFNDVETEKVCNIRNDYIGLRYSSPVWFDDEFPIEAPSNKYYCNFVKLYGVSNFLPSYRRLFYSSRSFDS